MNPLPVQMMQLLMARYFLERGKCVKISSFKISSYEGNPVTHESCESA